MLSAGFGFFVFFNTALLGSHDAKVGFGIIAVAINLMLWIWNDSAIVDVQASSKDIAGVDLETAIAKSLSKHPGRCTASWSLLSPFWSPAPSSTASSGNSTLPAGFQLSEPSRKQ
jgi:hypothetical protein